MMEDVCIDANVLIKIYAPDENKIDESLLEKITVEDLIIWAPGIICFEFAHVLGRKSRLQYIHPDEQQRALQKFFDLHLILMWNEELIKLSTDIQLDGVRSLYDASYLAVALIKDIPLITNDKEILKKGKKIHDQIYSVAQWMKH